MNNYSDFKDAGREVRDYDSPAKSSSQPKMKQHYEKLKLVSEDFPFLHGLRVGETCEITVKVKKVTESLNNDYDSDKKPYLEIEVLKISEPKTDSRMKKIADGMESHDNWEKEKR